MKLTSIFPATPLYQIVYNYTDSSGLINHSCFVVSSDTKSNAEAIAVQYIQDVIKPDEFFITKVVLLYIISEDKN